VISPARQSQFNETNESISDCLQLIRMRSTTKKYEVYVIPLQSNAFRQLNYQYFNHLSDSFSLHWLRKTNKAKLLPEPSFNSRRNAQAFVAQTHLLFCTSLLSAFTAWQVTTAERSTPKIQDVTKCFLKQFNKLFVRISKWTHIIFSW